MNSEVIEALNNFEPTEEDIARFKELLDLSHNEFNRPHCGLELTEVEKVYRWYNGYVP